MSQNNRDQILVKTRLLAEIISNQEEVQFFKQAEQQIEHNNRIQDLISLIKVKQKELVNAKALKKSNYIKKLEEELDFLNKELDDIPLVQQYQQSQVEINNYLKTIFKLIKEEISKNVPLDS